MGHPCPEVKRPEGESNQSPLNVAVVKEDMYFYFPRPTRAVHNTPYVISTVPYNTLDVYKCSNTNVVASNNLSMPWRNEGGVAV
jgi:hypothetical protein